MGSGKLAFIKFQLGTLLGPEGTASAKPLDLIRRDTELIFEKSLINLQVSTLIEYRPYFENYTVDASIFVEKLLSAHGGCLGIRSR